MNTDRKQRKHDYWMIPTTLVSIFCIFGIISGGAMWVKAQEKDITTIINLAEQNKARIEYLEQCAVDTKEVNASVREQLKNLTEISRRILNRQEKIIDELIDAHDKTDAYRSRNDDD